MIKKALLWNAVFLFCLFYSSVTFSQSITSISPANGPVGTLITITGTDLNAPTSITVGANATPAIIISSTSTSGVVMVMPGTNDGAIAITTGSGTASSSNFIVTATKGANFQQARLEGGASEVGTGRFGHKVALSADGSTAIIGGYGDNSNAGAAWMYTRSGATWTQRSKLIGSNGSATAQQGYSVAISADGSTVAVGGNNDNANEGAVWIYTRNIDGITWDQQGNKLVATDPIGAAQQGTSISLSADGNTLLSTGIADNGNIGAGWIFTRNATIWTQQTKLVPWDILGATPPQHGASAALSADGNTAIIGGRLDNVTKGAAWVYVRNGTTWSQQMKLVASNSVGTNVFQGISVALSANGNTALVGGNWDNSTKGAVWVYDRVGTTWTQTAKLIGSSSLSGAFGSAVALSADGTSAIIGASQDNAFVGAACFFVCTAGNWAQEGAKYVPTGASAGWSAGFSVALSADGTTGMVGAHSAVGSLGYAFAMSYTPIPVIYSFTPLAVETYQGKIVTIIGKNFTGATSVKFGSNSLSIPSPSFTVVSDTEIRAELGTGNGGNVYLTTPFGVSELAGLSLIRFNLSAIIPSSGTLSPVFAAGTSNYTVAVPPNISNITLKPIAFDPTSVIRINSTVVTSGSASGSLALNPGTNVIPIIVTPTNVGATGTKTYTVTITRAPITDLLSFTSSAGSFTPVFDAGTTAYTIGVTNAIMSATVTPTLVDVTAAMKVRINGGVYTDLTSGTASGALPLNEGANAIDVTITATDNTIKTYTLTINRISANANLSALTSSAGNITPAFAQGTISYAASVSNTTTSTTVTPTLADATATMQVRVNGGSYVAVTSGNASAALGLNVGANTIDVKVTAQDGTTVKTYSLTITRISTNADLSAITSTAGSISPVFAVAMTAYTASVNNTTASITVTLTLADATATMQVRANGGSYVAVTSGNASTALGLNVGANTIDVKVTAQDGTTIKTYTLTVTRATSAIANLSALTSTAGSISPTFAAGTTAYTANVANGVTTTTVTPTFADATATIQVRVNGGSYAALISGNASAALGLNVGANTIDVTITAQDGTTIKTYTLTVTRETPIPLTQTITFNSIPSKIYGATDFDPGASASSGLAINYTSSDPAVAIIISGKIHIIGAGTTIITAAQDGIPNYSAATQVNQTLTIAKAPLTISAVDKTKVQGTGNPPLTLTYAGFVYNQDNAVLLTQQQLSTSATTSSLAGTYSINIDGATAANYVINMINGTLTITEPPLVTVNTAPTLTFIPNQAICYTTGSQSIALSGISPGAEPSQTTTLTINTTNSNLFSAVTITAGSNGNGNINFTPANAVGGTATVTVTVKDNGGTANGGSDSFSRTFTITINASPVVFINSSLGTEVSKGATVFLTASGGTNYTWATADGIISGQNSEVLTVRPIQNTTYTVSASNAAGCIATQSIRLNTIEDYTLIQGTNLMTPNGDGLNDTWVIKNIDAYPNNQVKVFDLAGRVIYQKKGYTNAQGWDGYLNGTPLAEGSYFYIIDFGDTKKAIRGFVTILK